MSDFPHVTDVIALVRNMAFTPEFALERGRLVHRACALLDGWGDGSGLDWASLSPVLVPYVEAYAKWTKIAGIRWTDIEHTVINHKYRYQGRLDRVGDEDLADIKCGDVHPSEGLQTAAYAACYRRKLRRLTIHLYPNGRFKVEEWKDRADFPVFLGLLSAYQWQLKHSLIEPAQR